MSNVCIHHVNFCIVEHCLTISATCLATVTSLCFSQIGEMLLNIITVTIKRRGRSRRIECSRIDLTVNVAACWRVHTWRVIGSFLQLGWMDNHPLCLCRQGRISSDKGENDITTPFTCYLIVSLACRTMGSYFSTRTRSFFLCNVFRTDL